jgi:hypothetical protein
MLFLINVLLSSFVNGLFFFILFVFLLYWFYLKDLPVNEKPPTEPQFEEFSLSNSLLDSLNKNEASATEAKLNTTGNGDSSSVLALNMLFQFLFQELKDTKTVRRYIIRKLAAEFRELLNTKAAGRVIQKISVS